MCGGGFPSKERTHPIMEKLYILGFVVFGGGAVLGLGILALSMIWGALSESPVMWDPDLLIRCILAYLGLLMLYILLVILMPALIEISIYLRTRKGRE